MFTNKVYSFERLAVYQDMRVYIKQIYSISEKFPKKERFGLISQIQRAAVSVASNIVEGVMRSSIKEKERFIEIAYGSLMETFCQLQIALDLLYIDKKDFVILKLEIDKIANKLTALKRSWNG